MRPSCSSVVPYSCMWRRITSAILLFGPIAPNGTSKSRVLDAWLPVTGSENGASAETISASSMRPDAIAAEAWPSSETALAPPWPPASSRPGEMPRMSATSAGQNDCDWPAL